MIKQKIVTHFLIFFALSGVAQDLMPVIQEPVGDVAQIMMSVDGSNFLTIEQKASKLVLWDTDNRIQIGKFNFDAGIGPYSGKVVFIDYENVFVSADNRIVRHNFNTGDTTTFLKLNRSEFVTSFCHFSTAPSGFLVATKIYPNENALVKDITNIGRILKIDYQGHLQESMKIDYEITTLESYEHVPLAIFGTFDGRVSQISIPELEITSTQKYADRPIQELVTKNDRTYFTESIYSEEYSEYKQSLGKLHYMSDFGKNHIIYSMPKQDPNLSQEQMARFEDYIGKFDARAAINYIKDIIPLENSVLISFSYAGLCKIDHFTNLLSWKQVDLPCVNSLSVYKGNLLFNDCSLFIETVLKNIEFREGTSLFYYDYARNRTLQKIEGGKPLVSHGNISYSERSYPPMFITEKRDYDQSDTISFFPVNRTSVVQLISSGSNLQFDRGSGYLFVYNNRFEDEAGNFPYSNKKKILGVKFYIGSLKEGINYVSVTDGGKVLGISNSLDSDPYLKFPVNKTWDLTDLLELNDSKVGFAEVLNCEYFEKDDLFFATYYGSDSRKKKYARRYCTVILGANRPPHSLLDVYSFTVSNDLSFLAAKNLESGKNDTEMAVFSMDDYEKLYSTNVNQLYKYVFDKTENVLFYTSDQTTGVTLFALDFGREEFRPEVVISQTSFNAFDVDISNNRILVDNYTHVLLLDRTYQVTDTINTFDIRGTGRTGIDGIEKTSSGGFLIKGHNQAMFINENKQITRFLLYNNYSYIYITDKGYYQANRDLLHNLGFKRKNSGLMSFQLDPYLNRPDIVYSGLTNGNDEHFELLERAVLKRQKVNGIQDLDFEKLFLKMPQIAIGEVPNFTHDSILFVTVEASDSIGLASVRVVANGVPLFGKKHLALKQHHKLYNNTIQIPLAVGENKLSISVKNVNGLESIRKSMVVTYEPSGEVRKPDLFIITLSVSKYLQEEYNLTYARKDGEEVAELFSQDSLSYGSIHLKELYDSALTIEEFELLKPLLLTSKVDDQVIVFVSGHGLLDENDDFYFSAFDMDFEDPSKRGISYQSLEDLLDGIAARKKVLFIDACHSGEVDREVNERIDISSNSNLTSGWTGKGVVASTQTPRTGLSNSFEMMQILFANFSNGSGTSVISAAAGDSYALESDTWKNGVFTYCIKNALGANAENILYGDVNNDREVTISELRNYVLTEVQRQTNGAQRPTSRGDNLENDFVILSK